MAINFKDLIKDVENSIKAGFKKGYGWVPHTSAEGGTRTLAYGHKLSKAEEKGNYVELPDGSVVDFDDRGLTDAEAEALLDADIARAERIAAAQWDKYQDVPFGNLDPVHKNLLSEIVFNIGTLKNSKGNFGWPSLATGIKTNDTGMIKRELMRSFTDEKGNKTPLEARVNKIREYVDNPEIATSPIAQETSPKFDKTPPQAPQTPTVDPVKQLADTISLAIREARGDSPSPLRADETSEAVEEEVPSEAPVVEEETSTEEAPVDNQTALIAKIREIAEAKRAAGEKKLKRTANEAKLAKKANTEEPVDIIESLRSSPKAMKVIRSKVFNRPIPETPPEKEVARKPDASKDPIYGIF